MRGIFSAGGKSVVYWGDNSEFRGVRWNIKNMDQRIRPIMKKSATKIVHLIPNSELEALQGYYHGDISINHADDYVERVKRLVR